MSESKGKQHEPSQSGGGNASTYSKYRRHSVPAFQGQSGKPDNSNTNRPKGQS